MYNVRPLEVYRPIHHEYVLQIDRIYGILHRMATPANWGAVRLGSRNGRTNGPEADVGPDDGTSLFVSKVRVAHTGTSETNALERELSISLGVPELCAQSPRSPPGVPALSGG